LDAEITPSSLLTKTVRGTKGFTLIELLITIVLIGIISTVAVLSLGSGTQRDWQRQEAERLLQLCKLASQEAIIQGTPIALELFSQSYRFMHTEHGKWQPERQDAIFRPTALHAQLSMILELQKKPVFLSINENTSPKPHIVFTPDGDINLFQIKMALIDGDSVFIIANTLKDGLLMTTKPSNLAR
jgi:general secretion pathway protein H